METKKTLLARLGKLVPAWVGKLVPGWLKRVGPFAAVGLFAAGIVFWGGFNWALEMTNREEFCISCHEMKDNVYAEYKNTPHFQNHSGVRATCPDCHVPKEWQYKIVRKIQASKELWGHFITGSIWTREKFVDRRLELARHEWARMKSTDSRECRNCHGFDFMDFTKQETRAGKQHQLAVDTGKTCIDCHQGIAHRLPEGGRESYEKLMLEMKAEADQGSSKALASFAADLPRK